MKEFDGEKIRNVGLVGHGGSGKTSLAEAMLFSARATNRLGRVDDGTTISDYSQDEIERKISIGASLMNFELNGFKINLLDLPGYADFVGEVYGGLRVVETAAVVVNGLAGLEVGTEQAWALCEKYQVSRFLFINKIEKEHVDFDLVLEALQKRFGSAVLPLQLPIGSGLSFRGIVDVIKQKAYRFDGQKVNEETVPAQLQSRAQTVKQKLIEAAAESDDNLLELFFESGELTDDQLRIGLRKGIAASKIFPLLVGSATQNQGISLWLEALCEFSVTPADVPEIKGKSPGGQSPHVEVVRKCDPKEPMCSLVFKTISEPHVGELSFFRVYAGSVKPGDDVYNSTRNASERIGQIFSMNGKERREVGYVAAGDIGAFVKLKNTHTGDTLCDRKVPILLPSIDFPKPLINLAIKSRAKGDEEKIANGLARLHEEDPTFFMEVDSDIRQTIIYGQGELHLEVVVDRLKRKYGTEVELEKPRIPYRETIKSRTEIQGKYKKQTGGRGQYGDVWLRLEPLKRGEGFVFEDEVVGGVVPGKYIPSVEKGVVEAMQEGGLAGYRVVDVKVTIYDGSYHPVDSSDIAFKVAGSMAFKNGFMHCKPVLLEPIFNVQVMVPDEFMGDVMGDLSARRGKILGIQPDGSQQKIKAQVPLADLYKYSTSLRSLTQGRALYTREFSHYEEVPKEIAEKIIKEAQEQKAHEK